MNYDQREVAQKAAHGAVLHPDRITELTELKEPAAKVNYDESKVPAYTLPDVLTLNNGQKVVTIKEWVKKRRPELIHLFETQMYGKAPAHPKVTFPGADRRQKRIEWLGYPAGSGCLSHKR